MARDPIRYNTPEAQGTYQIPLVPVEKDPVQALYQYPMESNGFKKSEDGTHVFWPANQKIYSKFYVNLDYDKETFLGISQQAFLGLPTLKK